MIEKTTTFNSVCNRIQKYYKHELMALDNQEFDNFVASTVEIINKAYASEKPLHSVSYSAIELLLVYGDTFMEIVYQGKGNDGDIVISQPLPVDTMFRIEDINGNLLEFQKSQNGPDYERYLPSLPKKKNVTYYKPEHIAHVRLGKKISDAGYGLSYFENTYTPQEVAQFIIDKAWKS